MENRSAIRYHCSNGADRAGHSLRPHWRRAQITVTGVVRDTSGGVVVDATVEALVGDRRGCKDENGQRRHVQAHSPAAYTVRSTHAAHRICG